MNMIGDPNTRSIPYEKRVAMPTNKFYLGLGKHHDTITTNTNNKYDGFVS
jgi:hypothetical protein